MRLLRNKSFLQVIVFLSALVGLPSAFLALAARSDFHFRGCNELAPSDWPFTANCSDAHSVMWAMGSLAVVLLLFALLAVWRFLYV